MFSLHPSFRIGAAVIAAALALSACGGGGGGGSSPIPSTGNGSSGQPASQATGPAQMTILIPPLNQQNKHFRPNYISAATQSMSVGLVSGSTTTNLVTVNLTQSSPNCTVPSGGGLQCTTTVQAPFGTDTFVVATYSGANGTGSALSIGDVQVAIKQGGTTPTIALSLDGVPVAVALVLGQSELPVGSAGSTAVIVQAFDASDNLIIGPGLFATPIALAISGDTYKTLALSTTSVTTPGQVVTLNYNGNTNVGSTITPSGSGITTASSATFNATGAVLNLFQYFDAADDLYMYPYGVAALPNGTGAIFLEDEGDPYSIGIASPSGMQYVVTGNTVDPYNPGTGGVSYSGMTVINNMSEDLLYDEGYQYNELAAMPNGNVAYAASFTDNPQNSAKTGLCYGGELESGTLGIFNPSSKTTTEFVLQGYPEYIQADSENNVWFVEYTGTCGNGETTSYFFNDYYAIGELSAGGILTETDFATAGITSTALGGSPDPSAMSITPTGSTMYIADYDNEAIAKVALGSSPTLSAVAQTISTTSENLAPDEGGIATGPDGTTAFFSDEEGTDDNYFYGYVPGSAAFSTASVAQGLFPINSFYSYGMAFGDNSFWIAGEEYETGVGRLSNVAAGAPIAGYYAMPISDDDGQELVAISSGGGYVWAADDEYGNVDVLQYGAPSSGTMTYNRVRHLTNFARKRTFTAPLPKQRPAHKRRPMSLPRNP